MEQRFLTTTELAQLTGLKPGTLRQMRWRGTGPPYIRMGTGAKSRVLYDQEQLEKWCEEHTHSCTRDELGDEGSMLIEKAHARLREGR